MWSFSGNVNPVDLKHFTLTYGYKFDQLKLC